MVPSKEKFSTQNWRKKYRDNLGCKLGLKPVLMKAVNITGKGGGSYARPTKAYGNVIDIAHLDLGDKHLEMCSLVDAIAVRKKLEQSGMGRTDF